MSFPKRKQDASGRWIKADGEAQRLNLNLWRARHRAPRLPTSRVCPHCGYRDRKPGRDACGPCEQPIRMSR